MKNKGHVFNCLIIMLSELMYSPAHPGRNRAFRMSFTSPMLKRINCSGRRPKTGIMVLYYLIRIPLATLPARQPRHLISQILPVQQPTIFRVFGKLIIKGLTTGNDILGLYCRPERQSNRQLDPGYAGAGVY
jgi:hypothetical protein